MLSPYRNCVVRLWFYGGEDRLVTTCLSQVLEVDRSERRSGARPTRNHVTAGPLDAPSFMLLGRLGPN